ncbi:MAG: TonB-dependent receptor [Dysgonamonadaceae bacterium]|jgi:hypothetical protein|nr:TonB-dependent receptor [Dysgonamonadaceae bacterium]
MLSFNLLKVVMKKQLIFLFFFACLPGFSQNTSLQGVLLDAVSNEPAGNVPVWVKDRDLRTSSEADGSFYLENVPAGDLVLVIEPPATRAIEFPVNVVLYRANDVGTVYLAPPSNGFVNRGDLLLIEEQAVDEDSELGDYNVSSLMTSSNDVYVSNAAYNFSAVRFRLRGYENRYSDVYINGVNFNDPEKGNFSYGLIGGLNDATRSKDVVNFYQPSSYSFGQIGGATNIRTGAADFAPGGRTSLVYTNRSYKLRALATVSTGLMNNGWAVTGALGYRWADEGFIEGTFYNSLGYFLSVEKVFDTRHRLSLTVLGSPAQRAQQSPNLQETCDLLDDNYYNSYWGWQDGKKRNSRVITSFEPSAVLSHRFQLSRDTRLTTGLGFKYSLYGGTRLNWYDSADPRPDYYRYLPSYQTVPEMKEDYTARWTGKQAGLIQVDWDRLYRLNALNKLEGNGNASYMVEERHNDQLVYSLSSVLNTNLNKEIALTAGVEASITRGMHYKTVSDLLGGDYFLDIDQFAQRDLSGDFDFRQNDMNRPNREAVKGDRFGYDYDVHVHSANAWLQNTHRYRRWDLYYGFKTGYTSFFRYGNMRNGRAPGNSCGKGQVHTFVTQSSKLGLTYKLSGQHLFSGNVSYSTLPPLASKAYRSINIKDDAVNGLTAERVFSADLSYDLSTPVFRGRLSVFHTNFYDQTNTTYYYSNYEGGNTFVNYSLSGINKMYRGIEMGLEARLNAMITLSFAGTLAEYIYTNRPEGTESFENGLSEDYTETVYLKNFHVGGTPQTAGTFGVHGFYDYWFFDLNVNGFDRIYPDVSPSRRTERAIDFLADTPEEKAEMVRQIAYQERFDGGVTVDVSIGKSLRLNRKYTLNINCQFNNILNNTRIRSNGFEQSRFDYVSNNVNKFPSKYYYAQGFNFFLMAGLRF